MAEPFATRVANAIRKVTRKGGYEVIKTHRMNDVLERQDTLMRLAAANIDLPKGKGAVPVAEGIVFSKDRPLQLQLVLQTYVDMVSNKVPLTIQYTASTPAFAKAFDEVKAFFKDQDFTWVQETKFKPTLMTILRKVRADKMFFLCDDDVLLNKIDMKKHASVDPKEVLMNVAMSPQITHCYTTQRAMEKPLFTKVQGRPDLLEFKWGASTDMWDYPMMICGTLFDTREMIVMCEVLKFKAPNSLEGALMEFAHGYRQRKAYCYAQAALMNFPLNKVQTENNNYAGTSSGVEALLESWNQGMVIDPTPYYGMEFSGFKTLEPADEVPVRLVKRKKLKAVA